MEGEKLMAVDLGVPVKVPVPAVGTEEQVIGKDHQRFEHWILEQAAITTGIALCGLEA